MCKKSCSIGPPFSANNMYVPIDMGKMIKSKKYKSWLSVVVPQLTKDLSPAENFPIRIEITVVGGREWQSDRDIDNVCKPLVDALVKANIIPDDNSKYVEFASARFIPSPSKRGETLTRITYIEPEIPTSEWGQS